MLASLGARFSSTRSFKHRDPFRNAGEEFVNRLEIFLLQIRKVSQNLVLGRPLLETGLYPQLATQMILVGEESGRLEEMLNRVADVYDREVAMAVKRFLSVLEPALILGLAVLIGGIVFSILLGVMGMSELVV